MDVLEGYNQGKSHQENKIEQGLEGRGRKLPTWKTHEETSSGQSPARPELKSTSNSFGSIQTTGFPFPVLPTTEPRNPTNSVLVNITKLL